jgi:hypothetical protein
VDSHRRALCGSGLQLLLGLGLLRQASRAHALSGSLKWVARPWLTRLDEASGALSAGTLAPRARQSEVESVLGRLDLPDLLRSLDFEQLAAAAKFPAQGEGMERLYFPGEDGRLQFLRFRPYLFTLRKDVAVVPHGHHNMATLHMVLAGQARVRHYDRLEATDTHMLIRAASDEVARPGHVSSVSDEHHNIHWFQGLTEQVFMFNIGVSEIQSGAPSGDRDYVDPANGAMAGDGAMRVPRLTRAAAYARYGRL